MKKTLNHSEKKRERERTRYICDNFDVFIHQSDTMPTLQTKSGIGMENSNKLEWDIYGILLFPTKCIASFKVCRSSTYCSISQITEMVAPSKERPEPMSPRWNQS